jgi:hypothetical protein
VAEVRHSVLLRRCEALRDRQAALVHQITESCAGLFDELVAVATEVDSVGPLLFARDMGDAEQLMSRIGREKVPEAKAEAKAAVAG